MSCVNCGSNPLDIWKYEDDGGDYASFGDRGGGWAIIRPPKTKITNLIANPSMEANRNNWTIDAGSAIGVSNEASFSGAYSLKLENSTGGPVACHYNGGLTLDALGHLCAAVRIKTCRGSIIQLALGNPANTGVASQGGGLESFAVTTDDWAEYTICCNSIVSVALVGDFEISVSPGAGCPTPFVAYIDAAIVTPTSSPSSYFDGDTGGSWNGAPDNSTSYVDAGTRLFGEPVFLGDLGLTLLGDDGSGVPPLERSVEPYARRPGGAQTGAHWGSRSLRLTFGIEENSWAAVSKVRKKLIDLLALDPMSECNGNELMLRHYCIDECGEPDLTKYYELVVNYNSGLQYTRTGVFKEKIILELVADKNPLYSAPQDFCTPLTPNVYTTINNPLSISVPVRIYIRNGGATVVNTITNVTTGKVIKFTAGGAYTGSPMPFGATWKFSNVPGEFGVTQSVNGAATPITNLLSTEGGATPGSFFLAPGDNIIYPVLTLANGSQVTICYKKAHLSSDSVCNCDD